jgi:hypothetical protein
VYIKTGCNLLGRWTLDSHGDQMFASQQDETEHTLLFLLLFTSLGSHLAELLAIAEHDVHVLVERLERAYELAAVLECGAHAIVDVVQHFAALSLTRLEFIFDLISYY